LLIVEEAWVTALHSLFGAAVESWLRTLRKKNAAVVFVSQSVADVVNSPRHDNILESCPTKTESLTRLFFLTQCLLLAVTLEAMTHRPQGASEERYIRPL